MKSSQKIFKKKTVKTGYDLYEYYKKEIARTAKSHKEYEDRIFKLCKSLGI